SGADQYFAEPAGFETKERQSPPNVSSGTDDTWGLGKYLKHSFARRGAITFDGMSYVIVHTIFY
ncbi:MAG: hypothetical protein IIU29_02440, partial [Erysipelotrichaceae bacterium]|nr:hypothetical protein [Erysipelotrichaceae bacterium]